MSWKCDYCDSYNEDGVDVCYVCGHSRSEESLRLAKLLKIEERRNRISKMISGFTVIVYKGMFFLGLIVAVIAVVTLIMRIYNGDIFYFRMVFPVIFSRLVPKGDSFVSNLLIIWDHIKDAGMSLWDSVKVVLRVVFKIG